ncbi:MAG: glycosyltransferase family 4 protein [Caldilineaceae bacterium]
MMIKVAHITTVDLSLRLLLLNQMQAIRDAGYEVVGISTPGRYVADIERAGIRHIPVDMTRTFSPREDLVSLGSLVQVMRREGFDIVHTHNPKPGLLGQLAARLAGVPIVVNTLHGFYFHDGMGPFWRRFYITTETVAAYCSDVILSQNPEDIETAIATGIAGPQKLRHLGNGIDLRRFNPDEVKESTLIRKRKALGIRAGQPVVGFVGRLVQEKGLLEFLAAARLVLDRVPLARFLIIGPADEEKPDALTPSIAESFGIAGACIFTGMRDDMPDLYALMDVFVLPSHREGFPRSPMEASAMGVPCLVTDIRGCRETVEHGCNGWLMPVHNVNQLADAIATLLRNPALAAHMGAEARRKAVAEFDERLVFARVLDEYARLTKAKLAVSQTHALPFSQSIETAEL